MSTTANPRENDLSLSEDSLWQVYTHGGRTPTGLDAVKWAQRAVELGAGEVLLTSMDADGQLAGYDLDLTRTISVVVTVPVIASGGAGTLEHLHQAFTEGMADAVLAASIFHFGTYSIAQAKEYLEGLGHTNAIAALTDDAGAGLWSSCQALEVTLPVHRSMRRRPLQSMNQITTVIFDMFETLAQNPPGHWRSYLPGNRQRPGL